MASLLPHTLLDQQFLISSERVLFWEEEKTLITADLHIGKSGHFRRSGIGIPQSVYREDLQRLLTQILFFKAERLIIVGDLSHSQANLEMELFRKWRADFASLPIHLARGNHDILEESWYRELNIEVHDEPYRLGPFVFTHDPADNVAGDNYSFSGHVHPAVQFRGKGKQALRFPCFYFGKKQAILPAFSRFTGTYLIEPGKEEKAFAIVEKELVEMGTRMKGF